MKRHILPCMMGLALAAGPAFADEARTPPPSEPYYAPQPSGCDLVRLKIYFEPGTATLTPFARDAIGQISEQLAGCSVQRLNATAIAGDSSSEAPVVGLAEDRRNSVMNELLAQGIRASDVAIDTDLGNSVMSRTVDIELQTIPARVS
ncbi:OmpA family protein [Thalassovita mediterranea]|nr:OmpA family protein [Thalassovita mediterranea]